MKTTDYRRDFPLLMRRKQRPIWTTRRRRSARSACWMRKRRSTETQNANPLRGLYPLSIAATEACGGRARGGARFPARARARQEIIFTRNTTEGAEPRGVQLRAVATSSAGDEVVVSILEHHSNLLPWQMVCRQTGATLKFMDCEPDGSLDLNKVGSAHHRQDEARCRDARLQRHRARQPDPRDRGHGAPRRRGHRGGRRAEHAAYPCGRAGAGRGFPRLLRP